MNSPAPRSLADTVRGFDRAQLVTLLRLRPDLARPRPLSLGEVIERASTDASTHAAVEALDAWQRRVAEALAAAPESWSARHLTAALGAERHAVDAAVDALRKRGLVWGNDRSLRVPQAVRSVFGPHPAGLSNPSPVPLDDADLDRALHEVDDAERLVLDRLTWGPPTGHVPGAERAHRSDSPSAAERLLARRLLRALDNDTVVLPREVALRLREGQLFRDEVAAQVPAWPAGSDARVAESAGQGSAVEVVGAVEALITEIEQRSPRPLASGGMPRRELVNLGRATGLDTRVGWHLALAQQGGLVASSATAWLPTAHFDQWCREPLFTRWRWLMRAWLDLPGWPLTSSATAADANPARGRLAAAAELRLAPLGALVDADLLAERLRWRHPTWPEAECRLAASQTVDEASALGLVALGRRTGLWDATDDPGFPQPGRQFLVQSDLTAIAPGPLQVEVSRVLDLVAEREAPGPASVHRFTSTSVRAALDAGWQADRLLDWLAEHSATPLPQPLHYLVGDVARQHGAIRVAAVSALLTIDDPATLETVLRHPRAGELGLRKVASNLLSATAEAIDVVDLLRDLGHAPVAENTSGGVVQAPAARRLRVPPSPTRPQPVGTDQLTQLADDLLRNSSTRPAVDAGDLVDTLMGAQTSGAWLRLVHVGDDGSRRTERVRVLAVASGRVRLVAKGKGQFVVPLSRVASAEVDG